MTYTAEYLLDKNKASHSSFSQENPEQRLNQGLDTLSMPNLSETELQIASP